MTYFLRNILILSVLNTFTCIGMWSDEQLGNLINTLIWEEAGSDIGHTQVKNYLEQGNDVNRKCTQGACTHQGTLLYAACLNSRHNNTYALDLLLEHKADVNQGDGSAPIFDLIWGKAIPKIKRFLQCDDIDMNAVRFSGHTPYTFACERSTKEVQELIEEYIKKHPKKDALSERDRILDSIKAPLQTMVHIAGLVEKKPKDLSAKEKELQQTTHVQVPKLESDVLQQLDTFFKAPYSFSATEREQFLKQSAKCGSLPAVKKIHEKEPNNHDHNDTVLVEALLSGHDHIAHYIAKFVDDIPNNNRYTNILCVVCVDILHDETRGPRYFKYLNMITLLLNAGVKLDKMFFDFLKPQGKYFHKDIAMYYREYVRQRDLDYQCDVDNRKAKQKVKKI